jgi:hypothetical protein
LQYRSSCDHRCMSTKYQRRDAFPDDVSRRLQLVIRGQRTSVRLELCEASLGSVQTTTWLCRKDSVCCATNLLWLIRVPRSEMVQLALNFSTNSPPPAATVRSTFRILPPTQSASHQNAHVQRFLYGNSRCPMIHRRGCRSFRVCGLIFVGN